METDSKNVAETGHVTGVNANDPAHVNAAEADHVTVLDALDVTEFTRRLQTFYYRILMGWVKKKKQTVDIWKKFSFCLIFFHFFLLLKF